MGHTARRRQIDCVSALSADEDGQALVVRDAMSGRVEHVLRGHTGPIFAMAISSDRTRLMSSGRDQSIHVWDLTALGSGRAPFEVAQIRGHESYIWSLAFTPDGSKLLSGSGDHTVRIWDSRVRGSRSSADAVDRKHNAACTSP